MVRFLVVLRVVIGLTGVALDVLGFAGAPENWATWLGWIEIPWARLLVILGGLAFIVVALLWSRITSAAASRSGETSTVRDSTVLQNMSAGRDINIAVAGAPVESRFRRLDATISTSPHHEASEWRGIVVCNPAGNPPAKDCHGRLVRISRLDAPTPSDLPKIPRRMPWSWHERVAYATEIDIASGSEAVLDLVACWDDQPRFHVVRVVDERNAQSPSGHLPLGRYEFELLIACHTDGIPAHRVAVRIEALEPGAKDLRIVEIRSMVSTP